MKKQITSHFFKSMLAHKLLTALFIILSITCLCSVIFRGISNKNGLYIQLTTDKKEYQENEDIKVSLSVKNNNHFSLEPVVLHSTLPDKLTLTNNSTNTVSENSLGEQETIELAFTVAAQNPAGENISDQAELLDSKTNLSLPLYSSNIFTLLFTFMISSVLILIIYIMIKRKTFIHIAVLSAFTFILLISQALLAVGNWQLHNNKENYHELETTIRIDGQPYTLKGQAEYGAIEQISFHVIFSDHEDQPLSEQEVSFGQSAKEPSPPEREGYTFAGWSADFTKITSDLFLQAEYERNQYQVVFKNYDDTILAEQTVSHGEKAAEPEAPAREGYTFIGWDQSLEPVIDNLTVTAEYQINTYHVVFKDTDGSVLGESDAEHGTAAAAPEAPARSGYQFAGWTPSVDAVTSDLEVTASYQKIKSPASSQGSQKKSNAGNTSGSQASKPSAGSGSGSGSGVQDIIANAPGTYNEAEARQVLEIMNAGRAAAGLHPLTWDAELADYAKVRAAECYVSVSHTRPDGSSCFSLSPRIRGENLAGGQATPSAVYNAWYDSIGHRENMFRSSYKCVGIAKMTVPGSKYTYYWVQVFGN